MIGKLATKIQRDGLRATLRDLPGALSTTITDMHGVHYTKSGNAVIPIPPPKHISVELTSKCNLRCVMCALHSEESKYTGYGLNTGKRRATGHMDFGLVQKIVDEASSFFPKPIIGLNGSGEVLLYPEFNSVIMLMKQKRFKAGFNTNALLLHKEVADMLVELFEGTINISLDASQKSTYEKIRIGSNYDKVLENVMYLIEKRKKLRSKKPIIVVNLTKVNQPTSEIDEFVDYWSPIVDEVRIYEQISQTDLRYITKNEHIDNALSKRRRLCKAPFTDLIVSWDGSVAICCHDQLRLGDMIRANIKDTKILDVWRGSDYKNLRHCLITRTFSEIPVCGRCEMWILHT